jgi:hypothetical protein
LKLANLALAEAARLKIDKFFASMDAEFILNEYEQHQQQRSDEIDDLVADHLSDDDDDEEESSYFVEFESQGTEAVKTMTGFRTSEFMELYSIVEKKLKSRGRGRAPSISPIDSFFFVLVVLKHYEKWDKMSVTYRVKKTSLVNAIHRTLAKIEEPLCDTLIEPMFKGEQVAKGIKFDEYPEVALINDVTFQHRSRPKMLFRDAMYYFSGKHHAYGFKTEVGHAPNGLAMFVSDVYAGSVHDFTIFKDKLGVYRAFLEKKADEATIPDDGEQQDEYPDSWALMVDKGYQGVCDLTRAVLPTRGRRLSHADRQRNLKIARNRIICENFYGRLKKLFKIMEEKYRWDEKFYSGVFNICVALTNYHITKYPLRNEDGTYYRAVLNKYKQQHLAKKHKLEEANKRYYQRLKRRRLAQ